MKKLAIYCVTYNSYEELYVYIDSIQKAAENVAGRMGVDVYIADNTPTPQAIRYEGKNIRVAVENFPNNPGYMGAALKLWNETSAQYDFCAISNVDLCLEPDFFQRLITLPLENIGCIAPDIHTLATDIHENPNMEHRPKTLNFHIWHLSYTSPAFDRGYNRLRHLKRSGKKNMESHDIYAAHGSFMLFTREAVQAMGVIHFPSYMYGEEIFFAELIRRCGLKTTFFPALKIQNTGNVSTKHIPSRQSFAWRRESLNQLYRIYFK